MCYAKQREEIIARDVAERAGEGGLRQYVSHTLRRHGPADWRVTFTYNDGHTWEVTGPGQGRSVPTLA